MANNNNNSPDIDDWAYMITVLSGPFSLIVAAILALIAAFLPSQPNQADRSKDLTNFATILFGGGAAVTGTTQPRGRSSRNNANGQGTTNNSSPAQQPPGTSGENQTPPADPPSQ